MATAILQVADTGPLESLVVMLRSVGIHCTMPSDALKHKLRELGCDTVLNVEDLVRGMGYERPLPLPESGIADMARHDVLYVDVKAHRNGTKVWSKWPNLQERTLWYRINGGKPEHVINQRGDHGNEVDPPCPILTPNMWYATDRIDQLNELNLANVCLNGVHAKEATVIQHHTEQAPWHGRAYACWPPFHRFNDYVPNHRPELGKSAWSTRYTPPICLIHNFEGWGYGALRPMMDKLGIACYGVGSPRGLIPHNRIGHHLSQTLAMVHLKSSDAPGYAIYECLAAACPLICTRRLIWRCRMQDLLIPGKTCLVFDRETHEPLSSEDVVNCEREVGEHLRALHNAEYSHQIGEAGRQRLLELMWSDKNKEHVSSLRDFMRTNFPTLN